MSSPAHLNRNVRNLVAASAAGLFGTYVVGVALPLAALALGATTRQVAYLLAIEFVPLVALGPSLPNALSRRRSQPLLMIADLARFAALVTVPIAWWMDRLSITLLFVAMAVVGVASALFEPAFTALLADSTDQADIEAAGAKIGHAEAVALSAGPVVSGVIARTIAAPVAFVVHAIGTLLSAWSISQVDPDVEWPTPPADGRDARAASGTKVVLRHFELRPLLAVVSIGTLASHAVIALLTTHLVRSIGWSGLVVGALYALSNLAALLATPFVERLVGRTPGQRLTAGSIIALAGLLATTVPSQRWAYGAIGVGLTMYNIGFTTINTVQLRHTPTAVDAMRRDLVLGTFRRFTHGAMVIGLVAGGELGNWLGLRRGLIVAAASYGVAVVITLFTAAGRLVDPPAHVLSERGLGKSVANELGTQPRPVGGQLVGADAGGRGGERQLAHVYRWNDVKMHMWNFIPGDDEPDLGTREDPLLREADALARHYEMLRDGRGKVNPVVDLDARNDQGVPGRHRVDR